VADGDVSLRYRLLGEDAGASRAFNKVGQSSDHLHGRMIAVGTAIGSLAAGGAVALGSLAVSAVKTGLSTAAAMEQAKIAFTTLLGSEKAAGDYLKDLQNFAAHTPFEMQGLVDASRSLLGVGVSAGQAKGILQDFGDAAAAVGVGQDAFQRVVVATSQAIGNQRFMTADLNQIANNGIPIWTILSKAMGKSGPELRELASKGKLLSSDVLPALQAEMHKDYGGSLEAQSKTLSGEWSNLKDTVTNGLGNAFKGLAEWLEQKLPAAIDTLSKAFDDINNGINGFVGWLHQAGPAQDSVKGASDGLSSAVGTLFGWFKDSLIPALKHAAEQIMPAVQNAIATVSAAFRDHQGMVNLVVAVFKILASLITTILIPAMTQIVSAILATLGPAFRLIGILVETVVVPALKFLVNSFMNVAGIIVDGAAWAFGWIPGLGPKLKAAQSAFHKFRDDVNAALNGITKRTVASIDVAVRVNGQAVNIRGNQAGGFNFTTTTDGGGVQTRRAFARGGRPPVGVPSLVGEEGPEVFWPDSAGTVIPHGAATGGGDTHVHLHVPNGFVGSPDQLATALSDVISRAKARGLNLSFA
jgi:tape measure domain-containing protein